MKRFRTNTAALVLGIGVISLLATALPAQAVALPTGNAETIAFYREMAAKTHLYGTVLERQTGFASLQIVGDSFEWINAEQPPPGFSPATRRRSHSY